MIQKMKKKKELLNKVEKNYKEERAQAQHNLSERLEKQRIIMNKVL
jgi:hypothetical protein